MVAARGPVLNTVAPGLIVSCAAAMVVETLKVPLSATRTLPLRLLRKGVAAPSEKLNGLGGTPPVRTAAWSAASGPGSLPWKTQASAQRTVPVIVDANGERVADERWALYLPPEELEDARWRYQSPARIATRRGSPPQATPTAGPLRTISMRARCGAGARYSTRPG